VFTLGYLSDADYYRILDAAWALVMPTLAEGGGSFPVLEAIEQGIPVLSSNIPVMREMAERWNARLLWFDPRDPSDIAARLDALHSGYEGHLSTAREQVPRLLNRTWEDVALEYARTMGLELRS
jgi:glycosyltransferase involved in cell wall biosynthesis